MVGFESQVFVRLHRIVAGILKLIGQQFVHEADAAAFLQLINQQTTATLGDRAEREMKLVTAIAPLGSKDVAGQALRVNAYECCFVRVGLTHYQSKYVFRLRFGLKTE